MTRLALGTLVALSAMFALSACGQGAADDGVSLSEAELKGGCRYDCPRCTPADQVCMMRACVLVCPPKQTACTQTALCIQGYQWDSKSCSCVPAAPAPGNCTVDADCSATADYCTGCDCRALGTGQSLPACSGPGVRCFADPCMGKVAACVNNTCVIQ